MEKLKVIEKIKDSIVNHKYVVGQRLKEIDLTKEYGVGRSIIREALWHLEKEGFLEIEPNKGATVKDLTQKDIAQMYDIIGVLEGLSIRVATPKISDKDIGRIENLVLEMERNRKDQFKLFRINREFHELLTELGGNDRLIAIMNGTRSNMERMGLQSFYNQDQIKATLKEHREILDAIKERKAWRVENLIRKHYMTARDRLIKAINNTL